MPGAALLYARAMHKSTLITPAMFLALIAAPGCQGETPNNEPGEFGDPCVIGEPNDSPDGCASGKCYLGYCEEHCTTPEECQPVEGWERTCAVGLCHIVCDADDQCPQDLGASLVCGTNNWCKSEEFE